MKPPRITVLMPVFNGEKFIRSAIESILDQTFSDFELLVIDDGSTDASHEIAASFADARIRIETNGRNLGLIATLNRGLQLVKGEYIARMDADDYSFPERLERQLAFMEAQPEIGICGTWIEKVDDRGSTVIRLPENHGLIRFFMLFDNPFAHNTIMFRRSMLEAHTLTYDPNFKYSEDYELWDRCGHLTKLANLPEILVRYNYHSANTSNRFRREQGATAARIRRRQLLRLDPNITDEAVRLHNQLVNFEKIGDLDALIRTRAWLDQIVDLGCREWIIAGHTVWPLLSRFWYGACGALADRGFSLLRLFRSSPAGKLADLKWTWKLFLRCAFRRSIT